MKCTWKDVAREGLILLGKVVLLIAVWGGLAFLVWKGF